MTLGTGIARLTRREPAEWLQRWLDLAARLLAGDEPVERTEPRVPQRGGCLIVPSVVANEDQDGR